MTSKAVQVHSFSMEDPVSGLKVVDLPKPTLPEDDPEAVLVKLCLRPVNPADIFSVMGVYPGFQPSTLPAVPGLEGYGIVEDPGKTNFKAGQRVAGGPFPVVAGNGTWQQYTIYPASSLVPVPDEVSDESACQFFVNPVTVYGMLKELNIPKGEYLLQTAAGSTLGRQVIALCHHFGIKTINVVRRPEQAEELKDTLLKEGDAVIVSTEEDVGKRTMEVTNGAGAYGCIECVGGDLFASAAAGVRAGGIILLYGAMSGLTITVGIPDVLFRGVDVKGFWVSAWLDRKSAGEKKEVLSAVMDLMAKKVIEPYSGEKYKLEDVVEAIGKATSTARGGKVMLEG